MDDILTNAGYTVEPAPTPQPDAQQQPEAPNLGQGEHQAPTPTSGDVQAAPVASQTQSQQPTISYEEYEKLKRDYEEKDGIVTKLREMAEANVANEEWNRYKASAADDLRKELERAGIYDDDSFGSVQNLLYSKLDSIRDDFNGKFSDYQNQIQGWASDFEWQTTREQEADRLIQSRGLNPAIKQKLLEAPTREQMTQAADTAKYLTDLYMSSGVNQAIQQQEQQRRASGVDNMGGVNSGPIPQQELKPGNASDPHLRGALKEMLGL